MNSRAIFFQIDTNPQELIKRISELIDNDEFEERYSENVASGSYFRFTKKGVEYCLEICDFEAAFNWFITIDSDHVKGGQLEQSVIDFAQQELFNKILSQLTSNALLR